MAAIMFPRHQQTKTFSQLFLQFHPVRAVASVSIRAKTDKENAFSRGVKPFKEIPGPKRLPFVGSTIDFVRRGGYHFMHKIALERFKEYGPIYKDTIMGRTFLHLCDQTAAETFLTAETSRGKYPKRPLLEPYFSAQQEKGTHALLNTQGKEGQRLRKALSPKMMIPKSVYANMDNFNAVTDDLVTRFRNAADAKKSVTEITDLKKHLFDWSTESVGTFVFDMRIGLFENPPCKESQRFVSAVTEVTAELTTQLLLNLHFHKFFKTKPYKRYLELSYDCLKVSKTRTDRKLEELSVNKLQNTKTIPGSSLLSYLKSKNELSYHEIICNINESFGAGVDTTSYTTQWLLYHLANNPDVQEKLFQEVGPLLDRTGFLSVDDISKIPYLKACLKESQRLHPIVFGVGRITQENLVLCGYQVPSGTEVIYHNYAAGRDEKIFKEVNKFKPERWLGNEGEKIHPFTLMPFGYGPRMCIGKRIAEVEIFSLVSKLTKTFRIQSRSNNVRSVLKLLLVPDGPINLTLTERI